MGNSEETKPPKSEKSTSPAPPDQTDVHVFPDWAAMQAYYGSRVAIAPYYNSGVAAGHPPPAPPYIWGPQPMMSPYGAPYAALYSHGGVYAHHAVPMGSQPQSQKIPPSTAAGTPLSIDTHTKSTGNTDKGLMKKLKEFDGLAMSIGNGCAESTGGGSEHKQSQSLDTECSTDGSDGNTIGADQLKRKRISEGRPTKDGKHLTQCNSLPSVSPSSSNVGKPVPGAALSPGVGAKSSPCPSQSLAMVPPEAWLQNERELKRERRKQSNRESARRSRLRRQAETEELARKVDALTAENMALRSEINQLAEKSEKLGIENEAWLEKLKISGTGHTAGIGSRNNVNNGGSCVNTENLLCRVNNSGSVEKNPGDKDSSSNGKLHQLLDTSPRADAIAAG